MANNPIGHNVIEGSLGVVKVFFDGLDLGKTTADTELVIEEDNKEIIFQQDGTKAFDIVPTGISYMLNCTFGEIKTSLLEKVLRGFEKSGGAGNSAKYGRDMYVSRREKSKPMYVVRIDSEGTSSNDPLFKMNFYKASPEVTGSIQWGADTQRNLTVSFYIFLDVTELAFGYHGYASSLGINPIPA